MDFNSLFRSEESKDEGFRYALRALDRDGIHHSDDSKFQYSILKHEQEMIKELHLRGYDGELEVYGDHFNFAGTIVAYFDTEIFADRDEVRKYIVDYIKKNYKDEIKNNPHLEI